MERFKSRKFWLAVAGFITAVANGNIEAAVAVVVAYLGSQGYVDSKK